jgi:hypothetical protein
MKKNETTQKRRESFCRLCLESQQDAADYLRKMADEIEQAQGVTQVVERTAAALFLSEKTIWRELEK